MTATLRFGALLSVVACSGGTEYALEDENDVVPHDARPEILVTPTSLDFGRLTSTETGVLPFTVRNVGDADLTVVELTLEGPSFTILTPLVDLVLAPGAEVEVDVAYTPGTFGDEDGTAVVHSSDPASPQVPVALLGEGAAPELTITPAFHDFGAASIPCGDSVVLTLESTGEEPLRIDELSYASAGQLTLVDENAWPMELAPGEVATVEVVFEPTIAAADAGTLTVSSNDPRGDLPADQSAEGFWVETRVDAFDVLADPPVDFLFAVDQSASMNTEAADLGTAFGSFITAIADVTTDWQIAVVTLEDGCFNNGVLTPATPGYEALFQDAVSLGDHHDLTEALLELSYLSVSNGQLGICNVGFPRPGAMLHVVVVTDEDDLSSQSWGLYVTGLQTAVSHPDLLKISGVVDVNDSCGQGAAGYLDAIGYTGGLTLDVCDALWADQVDDFAAATLGIVTQYALTEPAAEETISVTVDGVPWTSGWSYDAALQSVILEAASFVGGEHVEVSYSVLAECP